MRFEQGYGWGWSQYGSESPAPLVARFQHAFAAIGLSDAIWKRSSDSAWASTGLSRLPSSPVGALYAFRVVAFNANDSVGCGWRGNADAPIAKRPLGAVGCFHTAVSIVAPRQGWVRNDSLAATGRVLQLCGEVYHTALAGTDLF